MKHYYVNKETMGNPNYNHEVHAEGCVWMPSAVNRIYLGYFSSCSDAIKKKQKSIIVMLMVVQLVVRFVIEVKGGTKIGKKPTCYATSEWWLAG